MGYERRGDEKVRLAATESPVPPQVELIDAMLPKLAERQVSREVSKPVTNAEILEGIRRHKRIAASVLCRGIADLLRAPDIASRQSQIGQKGRANNKKRAQRDIQWLNTDDPREVFSFSEICERLEINPQHLRAEIMRALEKPRRERMKFLKQVRSWLPTSSLSVGGAIDD